MKNVLKPSAKSVLIPLELATETSATHAPIQKEIVRSGACPLDLAKQTTLIILNEEMNHIIKILKSLDESGLLIKGISKTIKNEVKEQKEEFLSMLLGTLGTSLLGNILTGKGKIRAGEGTIRAGQDF